MVVGSWNAAPVLRIGRGEIALNDLKQRGKLEWSRFRATLLTKYRVTESPEQSGLARPLTIEGWGPLRASLTHGCRWPRSKACQLRLGGLQCAHQLRRLLLVD